MSRALTLKSDRRPNLRSGRSTRTEAPVNTGLVRLRWALGRNRLPALALLLLLALVVVGQLGLFERAAASVAQIVNQTAIDAGFAVKDVRLAGLDRTGPDEVLTALAINRGDALLGVDIEMLRARVEALPWVLSARISRQLPDGLSVAITERTPFALWQLEGALWLIDVSGTRITDQRLGTWRALPLVVGAGAAEHAGALFAMLDRQPGLSQRVTAAVRVGERRWDIRFDNGVRLMLPEDSPDYSAAEAWTRFASLERREAVLEREIAVLDMRLPDRLVVRVTPEGRDGMQDDGRRT